MGWWAASREQEQRLRQPGGLLQQVSRPLRLQPRRSQRALKPKRVLTDDVSAETLRILAQHVSGIRRAAEHAIGLMAGGKRQIVLSVPHDASRS
jgi:hypothetical protein